MEQSIELEIDLFADRIPSLEDIDQIMKIALSGEIQRLRFSEQLEANLDKTGPDDLLRIGIGLEILDRHREACETLQGASDCKEKYFYLAYALRSLDRFDEAIDSLQSSLKHQADSLAVSMEKIATFRQAKDADAAEAELANCGNYENVSGEYHYQRARILELKGLYGKAIDDYTKALELSPDHTDALFHLALRYDATGDEDDAIACYQKIISGGNCSVNALLNLTVLYEDYGQYNLASQCVEQVLEAFPNHARAILFQKDIDSSKTMYFDEEKEKSRSRENQILETPISDFELSVRSRNCLKKMDITTLGDLLNISEAELLSYKNFGETSLREIKIILESQGLSLGMALEDKNFAKGVLPAQPSDEDQGMLSKPMEDLQLSVRARKCLSKLNLRTIGDLTRTTDAELLGCKNFGVTSLNEINKALTAVGLSLRRLD